jgi:carboxypeptidase Taq
MSELPSQYQQLRDRLGEIHDLNKIGWVLNWDQRTMMAPGGAGVRAEQIATINRIAHEKFTADEVGGLLDALRGLEESEPADSEAAALIRRTRYDYERERRVPGELRVAMARAQALANGAWVAARRANDFAGFKPSLVEILDLKRAYADAVCQPGQSRYDALLDDYEHGITTAEVSEIFTSVRDGLQGLMAQVREHADQVDDGALRGDFPADQQASLCHSVLEPLGFNARAWRLDPTVHPFASNSATQDIRITTRYEPHILGPAFFGSLHEFGHGLYEHQVDPALERTPLCRGASLGWHESQSRMWENLVGRSRAFIHWVHPRLKRVFRKHFTRYDAEALYRAANRVQPSLIRIEADEVTYTLHIVIRFELEQELITGALSIDDLPAAWNQRMRDYLGVEVPSDSQGVLQDVHWSSGYFGYFPTYSLGSILASQLWTAIIRDIPDVEARIGRGDFAPLRAWLATNIHRHGRKFTPRELLQRTLGVDRIDVGPYLSYLHTKFGELYA